MGQPVAPQDYARLAVENLSGGGEVALLVLDGTGDPQLGVAACAVAGERPFGNRHAGARQNLHQGFGRLGGDFLQAQVVGLRLELHHVDAAILAGREGRAVRPKPPGEQGDDNGAQGQSGGDQRASRWCSAGSFDDGRRCGRVYRFPGFRRLAGVKPEPDLRHRLQVERRRVKASAQGAHLGDDAVYGVVTDNTPVPAGLDQLVATDGLSDVPSQDDKNFHDLGFNPLVLAGEPHPQGRRAYLHAAELEVRLSPKFDPGGGKLGNAAEDLSPTVGVGLAGPAHKVGALDLVERHRQPRAVDRQLNKFSACPRMLGLGAHPLRLGGFR